ncbi:MAG: carbohydrate ABC transporter permease [Clostridia bacterium]|nr:carbohydrate ABC transporter permease [Clostridia bacterium]
MKLRKRRSIPELVLYCFVSLIFALVAASYVYILFWMLKSSLSTHTEIVMNPFSWPKELHWSNFADLVNLFSINGNGFWNMLFNSVYFSVLGAFLQQITTATFAYCSTKYEFPGSKLIYPTILVIMTLPIYGSEGAKYRLISQLGMVDSYAHILLSIAGFTASYLYYHAFFKNLSWGYAEAAMIDGANDFKIYTRVMFPQAKPIFTALFLTTWLTSWNSYESALVYLPNLPTLPVGIYQFNQEMIYRARMDVLMAACFVVTVPALIMFIVFNKTLTTNISVGGLKG